MIFGLSEQVLILARGVSALDLRRVRKLDRNRIVRGVCRRTADRKQTSVESYVVERPRSNVAPEAANYPFMYSADHRIDLGVMLKPQYPDPSDRLRTWARSFVCGKRTDTLALLGDLNRRHQGIDQVSEPGNRGDAGPN